MSIAVLTRGTENTRVERRCFVPDCHSQVGPPALIFPIAGWFRIQTQQNVTDNHFHVLFAANKSSSRGHFGVYDQMVV